MDFIEVTSAKVEEIRKQQNENKQLLDMTTTNAQKLELELKDKSQFIQGKYEGVCKDIDEVHTTMNQLGSKIENLMKRVIKMNEVYETVFIERYKKSLDTKLQKKGKEVDEYKEKKKKMLDELADNFKKLHT